MPLTLASLSPDAVIAGAGPTLEHAAAELRLHRALSGRGGGTVEVRLSADASPGDGFEVSVDGESVAIRGESARGALNGVYWLLERLGCLWVRPGPEGVRFVPGQSLADGFYRERPAFPRRTLILGNDALHDEWPDWLEFASRNRLNSVFFHDTPPSLLDRGGRVRPHAGEEIAADGKGWLFERWDADGPAIRAAAASHGIALQFGGHHLPGLLPRELFAEHPGWFPMRDGQRDARYNLCTSSTGAVAELRARARDFFRRFGVAAVYHLWADDILGGGWCSCEACAGLSPSDQALKATNVVAEALAEVDPSAAVAHLAYHDTIAPPARFVPGANVTALYAPRNRNYAFPIDDPACERNVRGHYQELEGLARTFAGKPGALAAFEYYSDAILYKWMAPPNIAVLPADAAAYRRAGVTDFGNLAVTPRPWIGPTWHAWWFARCAWDTAADPALEVERFCGASFGADGPAFASQLHKFEHAYRLLLDLGDLERIPRHDVLDFSDTPREGLRRKAAQMAEALAVMNAAVASLPLAPGGLGGAFREELAVQLAAANHLGERVMAWDAALDGRRAEAEAHLSLARLHFSALQDWDRTHTPPAYWNLSRGMLRAASWHTEKVAQSIPAAD